MRAEPSWPKGASLRVVVACCAESRGAVAPNSSEARRFLPTSVHCRPPPSLLLPLVVHPAACPTPPTPSRPPASKQTCVPSSRMSTRSVGGAHPSRCEIYVHQYPCLAEKRKAEAERIRQKYPDRIPVSTTSAPQVLTIDRAHAAEPATLRSSARRQTRPTSLRLTRRSTWYHQYVDSLAVWSCK